MNRLSSRAILALSLLLTGVANAESTILADFESANLGSYSPRGGWSAFGAGTTDRGVHTSGSSGQGAFHSINWDLATWGIGDIATSAIDLSAYEGVTIDARLVPLTDYAGSAALELAFDLPSGAEYATPPQPRTDDYQTLTFNFADLACTAGSGALDLSAGTPKLIVRSNGQSGSCRFDFDEITAFNSPTGSDTLEPVVLNRPWDGDTVRAMWLYTGSGTTRVDDLAQAQQILDFCAREGVNRIYFGGYYIWAIAGESLRDDLRHFLEVAHASSITVDALLDGFDWHENPSLVRTRLDQILAFQNGTPNNLLDDFDGIHFDVEFWLDDSWTGTETQRQQIAVAYFDNVLVNARDHLASKDASHLTLGIDMIAHTDTTNFFPNAFDYDGVTQHFIEHCLDLVEDVVLMSYYDSVNSLGSTTLAELDLTAGKGRTITLGADIQTGELPINTFADNLPTPYASMTQVLQGYHDKLTAQRLAALSGFCVFHYDGYRAFAPPTRLKADLDGDEDIDAADFDLLNAYFTGPGILAVGSELDADFDGNGAVELADVAQFAPCFTGSGGITLDPDCAR